ncbi:MAG: TIGR04372 family glycosyltransferase [Rhodospirillales bacterium]
MLSEAKHVAGFLGCQALGNFIIYQLTLAAAARDLGAERVTAVWHDDRPYKALISALNPAITDTIVLGVDHGPALPLDWLESDQAPDLLLLPERLEIDRIRPPIPGLRFPSALEAPAAEALRSLGLDPRRWFVAVHLRGTGYALRKGVDPRRSVTVEPYLPALRRIQEAGGQLLRIGDPSIAPWPADLEAIDLAGIADSIVLQAFAISRARFFLGVDSGPTQLASGLKVPTLSTNAFGVGCWNNADRVLFKRFSDRRTGRPLDTEDLFSIMDAALQVLYRADEIAIADNTADDLLHAVEVMLATTGGTTSWRRSWPAEDAPGPEGFTFPGPLGLVRDSRPFGVIEPLGHIEKT